MLQCLSMVQTLRMFISSQFEIIILCCYIDILMFIDIRSLKVEHLRIQFFLTLSKHLKCECNKACAFIDEISRSSAHIVNKYKHKNFPQQTKILSFGMRVNSVKRLTKWWSLLLFHDDSRFSCFVYVVREHQLGRSRCLPYL